MGGRVSDQGNNHCACRLSALPRQPAPAPPGLVSRLCDQNREPRRGGVLVRIRSVAQRYGFLCWFLSSSQKPTIRARPFIIGRQWRPLYSHPTFEAATRPRSAERRPRQTVVRSARVEARGCRFLAETQHAPSNWDAARSCTSAGASPSSRRRTRAAASRHPSLRADRTTPRP